MLLIGLTGSIATGKSTVSSLLSSPPYSIPIIDADVLARKVVEPGTPAYNAIVDYFGPSTPDLLYPDETENQYTQGKGRAINRPVLGRRVFGNDPERRKDRKVLNGIVHPAVRKEMYYSLLYYYIRGHWAVVLDVPLLFEAGIDLICGTVIVVGVHDRKIQLERLRARDPHLSAADAENRVNSQGDVLEKTRRAEFRGTSNARGVVVWNDADKEQLEREVHKAVQSVRESSPRWWSWVLLACPPFAAGVAGWNLVMNYWNRKDWEKTLEQERARL
ncbi:dephospho-CoA kinase [Ascosphaera apis ARSEF 7405]|uniref:Dephospho-CoA kinase n=1 Tax=Ascosphaera apis ARSEF 7405 TaxID=392613 RepID=A0A167YGM9_9EURO|nr:dephospho-CoA kinase [Ascosphaera apis ARSEF 7405]